MKILEILKKVAKAVIQSGLIGGKVGSVVNKIDPDIIDDAFGVTKQSFASVVQNTPTLLPVDKKVVVSHKLPSAFKWILNCGQLSKTMDLALSFCGLLEFKGKDNNPTIIEWAKELNVSSYYNRDSIAWCGLGQAIVVKRVGYALPLNFLSAKSWAKYGREVKLEDIRFGDIVVLNRDNDPALGHVTRYIGHNGKDLFCGYGANQSDSWSFAWFSKSRIFSVRRDPFMIGMPASMKNYLLQQSGEISTNES